MQFSQPLFNRAGEYEFEYITKAALGRAGICSGWVVGLVIYCCPYRASCLAGAAQPGAYWRFRDKSELGKR